MRAEIEKLNGDIKRLEALMADTLDAVSAARLAIRELGGANGACATAWIGRDISRPLPPIDDSSEAPEAYLEAVSRLEGAERVRFDKRMARMASFRAEIAERWLRTMHAVRKLEAAKGKSGGGYGNQ